MRFKRSHPQLICTLLRSSALALGSIVWAAAAHAQDRPRSKPVSKDGLSLTVSLDKSEYRSGEPVTISFVLKNDGDGAIFIGDGYLAPDYHEAGPGRHFEVHMTADGNKPLYFWSGTMTEGSGAGIRRVFRLDRGETYKGTICIFRPFEERLSAKQLGGSLEDKT